MEATNFSEFRNAALMAGKKKYKQLIAKKKTGWIYKRSARTLQYSQDGVWQYEVDLERCGSGGAILDWLFQVLGKTWCDAECFYELCQAIDFLLKPQAHFVRPGLPGARKPDVRELLKGVRREYGS